MKTLYFILIFSLGFINPAISQEECSRFDFDPVMGKDGRQYLNACFMKKHGVKARKDQEWHESDYILTDTMTWEIHRVCTPLRSHTIIRKLSDGTFVYRHSETDSLFRGNQNTCRCLSKGTKIETEKGTIPVEKIKVGDLVWTIEKGERVLKPVVKINKDLISDKHEMVYLKLEDGREVKVSAIHPVQSYKKGFGTVKNGDKIDSTTVVSVEIVPYSEKYTYDILPAGSTGIYRANGIPMGSTLSQFFDPESGDKIEKISFLEQRWQEAIDIDDYLSSTRPFPYGIPVYRLNLEEKYSVSRFYPCEFRVDDLTCLQIMGWKLIEGEKDTLKIDYLYDRYCNVGYDPYGPEDPGPPPPVSVSSRFIILDLSIDRMELVFCDDNFKRDTVTLLSPSGVIKEQETIQSRLMEKHNAIHINSLTVQDGILNYQGKPYTGNVIEFYTNYTPAIQVNRIFSLNNGIKEGLYEQYYIDGHIHIRGNYSSGEKTGLWQWFDTHGNVTKEERL